VLHSSVARTGWDEPPRASLFCIRGADGAPAWSAAEREYLFNPLVFGGTVFVCSNTTVRAYSLDDGRLLAALPLKAEAASLQLAPCSTADMLYVWRDGHGQEPDSVAAVEPATSKRLFRGETLTLRERWRIGEPRGLCGAPMALLGERLVYLTHDGIVCVIDRATGAGVAEVALKSRPNKSGGLRLAGARLIAVHGRDVFCLPP
jgi:outer membrane protein assembly factor BamB